MSTIDIEALRRLHQLWIAEQSNDEEGAKQLVLVMAFLPAIITALERAEQLEALVQDWPERLQLLAAGTVGGLVCGTYGLFTGGSCREACLALCYRPGSGK